MPTNRIEYDIIKHSTNYYRKNKEKRKIIHSCPHCCYETTGPKSSLKAHIWSKHTEEKDRPFQCHVIDCCRGFAQKINLQKHLKKVHNISVDLKINTNIAEYHIELTRIIPKSIKIQNRIKFYMKHSIIYPKDLNKPIEYIGNQIIKSNHLYYDAREGYINLKSLSYDDLKKKKKKKKYNLIIK